MTTIPISVVTCTRNPRPDYFRRLIDSLSVQSLNRTEWEFLIVDNASSDPQQIAAEGARIGARIIVEPRVGLTHARLAGISSTTGSIIVFFDDDNVPNSTYLENALEIAALFPFIGSWGGSVSGEFESPIPPWMQRRLRMVAVREVANDFWSNLPGTADSMPLGAGLCVRRSVAQRYLELHESGMRPIVLDRAGDSLVSGGDEDLAACAVDVGLGLGVFRKLKLTHLIPAGRFDASYMVRLAYGIAYSGVIRKWYHGEQPASGKRSMQSSIAEALRRRIMTREDRSIRIAEAQGRAQAIADINALRHPPKASSKTSNPE